ncbi:MAG TPA: hypothetical protein VLW65_12845 [Bryobacteraceae bacterium]|nr:hypothetical protein [Bryobacteraceae bacterium]
MDREHVIATLRGHESELRAAGIQRFADILALAQLSLGRDASTRPDPSASEWRVIRQHPDHREGEIL